MNLSFLFNPSLPDNSPSVNSFITALFPPPSRRAPCFLTPISMCATACSSASYALAREVSSRATGDYVSEAEEPRYSKLRIPGGWHSSGVPQRRARKEHRGVNWDRTRRPKGRTRRSLLFGDDFIDHAVGFGFAGIHPIVAVGVLMYLGDRLASVMGQYLI